MTRGEPHVAQLVLIRHGETEWSAARRHTGRTDLPLAAEGEEQAKHASRLVRDHPFALVILVTPLVIAAYGDEGPQRRSGGCLVG